MTTLTFLIGIFLTLIHIVATATNETNAATLPNEEDNASPTDVTTSLRPLPEQRCFGGFVCQHGICSPSKSSCICDEGWTGIFCHVSCTLDCGTNGFCDVFSNGTQFCSCNFGYTGVHCGIKKEQVLHQTQDSTLQTTTEEHPSSQTEHNSCISGFPCFHGHCPSGQLKCVCDEGWIGQFCNTPCNLDCGAKGACSVVGGQQVCLCAGGYTGPTCSDQVSTSPNSTSRVNRVSVSTTVSDAITTTTTTTSILKNADDLRPLSERQCVPGFVCKHGICRKGQLKCICDKGWVGLFCQNPCNLDCGRFGQCVVNPAGQRCDCAVGFTGSRCGSVVNITPKESSTESTDTASSEAHTGSPPPSPSVTLPPPFNVSTTLRPLPLRQCVPGSSAFVCKHGTCFKGPKNKTTIIGSVLECVCDPGWIGVFCHEPCPLNCGDHGRCNVFKNGTVYCSCSHEYMGPRCQKLRPKPELEMHTPTWHWWVVGSCVFLLFVLLLLLIILLYILWKRRFIFIMKIVYMFQPFEDDDDKLFDAFVSYKSTKLDEDFVVHTLYPKLEKSLNFKLCLHFRDFIPGETIANNIINAVENSRRTIMILTPSYIQSEFCRFEYQRAQHEMLKRKQRIIPIVLQDISDDRMFMDETLRTILDTITYIEWPAEGNEKKVDKFWKRVELSMPKKRSSSRLSNNNDNTSDAYNGTYSFPLYSVSETPPSEQSQSDWCHINGDSSQNDWNPRGFGHVNDSFTDSGDDFHSIDINDDSSSSEIPRNGLFSNEVNTDTNGTGEKNSISPLS